MSAQFDPTKSPAEGGPWTEFHEQKYRHVQSMLQLVGVDVREVLATEIEEKIEYYRRREVMRALERIVNETKNA